MTSQPIRTQFMLLRMGVNFSKISVVLSHLDMQSGVHNLITLKVATFSSNFNGIRGLSITSFKLDLNDGETQKQVD